MAYKKWSIQEHLYLDPINLISKHNISGYDYLVIPSYNIRKNEEIPEFFCWFRLLKQEYITARYLLFQSIEIREKGHFVDENIDHYYSNEFVNRIMLAEDIISEEVKTSQYLFGLSSALMKSSFSKAYGIFDKIAEFIFAFWEIEVTNKNGEKKDNPIISFGNIWYNNLSIQQGINPKLINNKNIFLKALHYLSYDITGKEIPEEYLLPQFKMLHEIRNSLEHKGIMITQDDYSVKSVLLKTISEKEFIQYNLMLLRLVRNTLFYLSEAVGLDQYNHHMKLDVY